jgi:hypothetical protein
MSQEGESKNKIQVSSQKKNLAFYVYLSKKFLSTEETVELSGLGNGKYYSDFIDN